VRRHGGACGLTSYSPRVSRLGRMSDTRSLIGRLGIWGHIGGLPAAEARSFVAHAAELGYGALWVVRASVAIRWRVWRRWLT